VEEVLELWIGGGRVLWKIHGNEEEHFLPQQPRQMPFLKRKCFHLSNSRVKVNRDIEKLMDGCQRTSSRKNPGTSRAKGRENQALGTHQTSTFWL
jgi:hypothetical protein